MSLKAGDRVSIAYYTRPPEVATVVNPHPSACGFIEVEEECLGEPLRYEVLASKCTVIEEAEK